MKHDRAAHVVIFGKISSCCSACAPKNYNEKEVVEAVDQRLGGSFEAVDVATVRPGRSSPSPCNQYPDTHTHWFLIRKGH